MLAKKNRVKSKTDINLVFKMGKRYQSDYLTIKYLPKKSQILRFGISLGVKVSGSAAERNRVKRIISEHIRKKTLVTGIRGDVIIFFNRKITKRELSDERTILKNLDLVLEKWQKSNSESHKK